MSRSPRPEADPSPSAIRHSIAARLRDARAESDRVFEMLAPGALFERPIRERHRVLFYLGHIEAFDWNLIARTTMGRDPFNAEFDALFAFGIDPVGGGLPNDKPGDWPDVNEIRRYNRRVRDTVDGILEAADFSESEELADGTVFEVAIEHRLMHVETLAYMLHWLPPHLKARPNPDSGLPEATAPGNRVRVPEGHAVLGRKRGSGFGWDNEFDQVLEHVSEFDIDRDNVTNGEFAEFVRAGGYQDRTLWEDRDWEWKTSEGVEHPRFWEREGEGWMLRNMFDRTPLPEDWPVYVSQAEAAAFARWRNRRLPTESEWDRAAYATTDGSEHLYPWGDEPPDASRGNFGGRWWNPAPVGTFPDGASALGIRNLVGNGWEWTSTVFGPLAGFERFPFYPGYSADFFDGKHYVMKGGSARTAATFLRRSFRNWFQPHYPNIYATFRTVSS